MTTRFLYQILLMVHVSSNHAYIFQIGIGGEIPKSYYLQLTSEEMENFTTVNIKRASSLQVDIDIKTYGSVIRYGIIYNLQSKMRLIIPSLPKGGGGILFYLCPSKIFVVAFFSVTVDGRNLIFGHKHHIGIPYCG